MMCWRRARCNTCQKPGFTLVEILIVLAIFSVLAAVALPMVRQMVSDQKGANTSRAITAFFDQTRRRAIVEGRSMGVLVERLATNGGMQPMSASLRLRQMVGVPAYSGESSGAFATLRADPFWPAGAADRDSLELDTAVFAAHDNQLLWLSGELANDSYERAPIRVGDLMEFPGGRTVVIEQIRNISVAGVPQDVWVNFRFFDVKDDPATPGFRTRRFPDSEFLVREPVVDTSGSGTSGGFQVVGGLVVDNNPPVVQYKIHRSPSPSSSAPYNLPRGAVIDLNYSGMGAFGNEFAPHLGQTNSHVLLTFAANGSVSQISYSDSTGTTVQTPPTAPIFFCIGDSDGVRPDSLFSTEERAVANLLNLKSIWVVINPNTGRAVASPFASVVVPATATPNLSNPHSNELDVPINEAREFAFLSDTLDSK